MEASQLQFIDAILGIRTDLAVYVERKQTQRDAVASVMEELQPQKPAIIAGYNVRLIDSRDGSQHEFAFDKGGQERSLDTHVATRKGRGLSPEDMQRAMKAHEMIVAAARKLIDRKDAEGRPLFSDPRELTQEFFTPLVREGVMPENFVVDAYSEVQEMLNAAFASYKETTQASRDEAQRVQAEEWAKRNGGSDGVDKLAAGLKHLGASANKLLDRVGLNAKARNRLELASACAKAGIDFVLMELTIAKWDREPGREFSNIEQSFESFLNPRQEGSSQTDQDLLRLEQAQTFRKEKIQGIEWLSRGEKGDLLKVLERTEQVDFKIGTTAASGVLPEAGDVINKVALTGDKLKKLTEVLERSHHEWTNRESARDAARQIDDALARRTAEVFGKSAGTEIQGRFIRSCDFAVIGAAVSETKADDQAVITEMRVSLAAALLSGLGPEAAGCAQRLADGFHRRAPGEAFRKLLNKNPAGAFKLLTSAAEEAIAEALTQVGADLQQSIQQDQVRKSLEAAVGGVEEALAAALQSAAGANAAAAFEGMYAAQVDVRAALLAALSDPPDAQRVVASFAAGFTAAFLAASPSPADKAFGRVGRKIAGSLVSSLDLATLAEQLQDDPRAAAAAIVQAAKSATRDGVQSSDSLLTQLSDPATLRQIAGKAALPDDGAELLEELEQGDAEIQEYERQLVLIDQGTASSAELKSIESLIEQMRQDKMIAELVLASGSILTGLASTSVSIAGAATENITDVLVGEIAGPLKAAKLIVKFGVAMKRAHDRRKLFESFQRTLAVSKRANSALRSTVQGFLDNKSEQIAFRAIEDALTLVQIASAILGSVPEPVTMAVGKTMSAIATSAESALKASEMIYGEVKLAHAWRVTLAAIRNPRERSTGLAALRLNPTLGMHAIAWAAMEKQPADPVARMLLSELGLNEQTLAVSGTEAKVREYLVTLLSEDRSLVDASRLGADWMPRDVQLNLRDWSTAVFRASREAVPPLAPGGARDVLIALKPLEKVDLSVLAEEADQGVLAPERGEQLLAAAARLTQTLREYEPTAEDGSRHEEMAGLVARFLQLAVEKERRIREICDAFMQTEGEG